MEGQDMSEKAVHHMLGGQDPHTALEDVLK